MDTTTLYEMYTTKDLDHLNIDRILNANIRYLVSTDIHLLSDPSLNKRFPLVMLRHHDSIWISSGMAPNDQKVLAFELQLKHNSLSEAVRDLCRVARSFQCGIVRLFTEVSENAYRVKGLQYHMHLPGDQL
jgi:hypothetical protein